MHLNRLSSAVLVPFLLLSSCSLTSDSAKRRYFDRAQEFEKQGKYDDAILNYRNAIKRDSEFGPAYYHLGLALVKRDRYVEAYTALQQAVRLRPDDRATQLALANLALGSYFADPGRPRALYDQVVQISDKLLAKNAEDVDGLRLKGFLAATENKMQDASDLLERANKAKPRNPEVVVTLFQVRTRLGRPDEAEALARDLIAANPTFNTMYGVLYAQLVSRGKMAEAGELLRQQAAANPKDAQIALRHCQHLFEHAPQGGAECVAQVAARGDQYENVRLYLGDFHRARQEYDKALSEYRLGEKASPQIALSYQYRIKDTLLAAGRREEAIKVIDGILRQNPTDGAARRDRAVLDLESGTPAGIAQAVKELQDLATKLPNNPDIRYQLGRAHKASGNLMAAASDFKQVGDIPSITALVEVLLAQKQYASALEYAERLPDSKEARLLKSASLLGLGQHRRAEEILKNAMRQDPQSAEAKIQYSFVQLGLGNAGEAESLLKQMYRPGQKDLRPLLGLAEIAMAKGDSARALNLLQTELSSAADPVAVGRHLGDAAARAGKYDVAVAQYRKLLAGRSGDAADLHVRLGDVYQLAGDGAAAMREYQTAVQIAPKSATPHSALAFLQLTAGQNAEALENYKKALGQQPDDPMILNNLAFLQADSGGNLDEALRLVQRAQTKMPSNPMITDTLGWVYYRKGMIDSAQQIFRNLAAKYPSQGVYQYHLGLTLAKKGNAQEARQRLQAAIKSGISKAEEQEAQKLLKTL